MRAMRRLVRKRFSMWHVVVGSLMLWLFIYMYKHRPSLPILERLQRQFKYTHNPNQILEETQKSLNKLSLLFNHGEHLVSLVKENIEHVDEVGVVLGNAATLIETLKVQLYVERTAQNGHLPSIKHEELTRKIENGINEMWYFIASVVKKEGNTMEPNKTYTTNEEDMSALDRISEEYTLLLRDIHDLKAASGPKGWREQEAKELSEIVQRQLYKLQNPIDCNNARLLVVSTGRGCGFGCIAHKLAYDFILAIGLNRTLVLAPTEFSYHKNGWEAAFLPISRNCSFNYIRSRTDSVFNTKKRVLQKYTNTNDIKLLPFMPRAIPEHLAARLLRLHGQPFVWWVGQLLKYLMRPQPFLQEDFVVTEKWLGFKRPIVGVHIRRSDKIGLEADFHYVDEYMSHVELYYKHLSKHGPVDKKRIYLATDARGVHAEIAKNFPEYEVISDKMNSKLAGQQQFRYTGPSLRSVIMDIHFLSMTDYLVCTFSSQVCRLAYELMQTQHPDASSWFHSLDDIYYFGEQIDHLQEVLVDHLPRTHEEIELKKGDTIKVAGNHWNGYSKGTNLRTGKKGLYPSFKVKDHKVISEFAMDNTIRSLNLIRSQNINKRRGFDSNDITDWYIY